MQTVVARLLVGTERQEIRLRLTDDTLYVDKQELSYSSSCLPNELQIDPTLLTKVYTASFCPRIKFKYKNDQVCLNYNNRGRHGRANRD